MTDITIQFIGPGDVALMDAAFALYSSAIEKSGAEAGGRVSRAGGS